MGLNEAFENGETPLEEKKITETYIKSIRAADQNNYEALLEFCRT